MDDQRLEELIRMAVEIDDLESADIDGANESAPRLTLTQDPARLMLDSRPVHSGRRHTLRWVASMTVTAAAACIAAAFFWSSGDQTDSNRDAPGVVLNAPASEQTVPAVALRNPKPAVLVDANRLAVQPASGAPYVVLSIFRSRDGACQCRSWRVHRLEPGQTLAQLEPGELIDLALNTLCVRSVEKMMVVALAGRSDDLPLQRDQAEGLLECMEQSPPLPDDDARSPIMGRGCVPESLTVRTQFVDFQPR